MSEDLIKAKAEYEESIKNKSAAEQEAAKQAWNNSLERVRSVLVEKLNKLDTIKVVDKSVNSKMKEELYAITVETDSIKNDVANPALKTLSQYEYQQISILRSTIVGIGAGANSYRNSLRVVYDRNDYLDKKQDEDIKKIQSDIDTIDGLKF